MSKYAFALFAVVLAACAGSSRSVAPPPPMSSAGGGVYYNGEPGPIPVGVIPEGTLRDASRGKDLQLSIDYPTKTGSYPVIIFSHGFGGSKNGYEGLASYWASHGYVVIRPNHADAGAIKHLRDVEHIWENQGPKEWRNRARDVSVIIDSFDDLEQRYPE